MAVEPMSSISFSIFSSTAATFSSRWQIASLACCTSSFHYSHSFLASFFSARYKVRRPSFAYLVTILSVSTKSFDYRDSLERRSVITESAPLQSKVIFLSLSSTITDILFLVEVNSQTFNLLNF